MPPGEGASCVTISPLLTQFDAHGECAHEHQARQRDTRRPTWTWRAEKAHHWQSTGKSANPAHPTRSPTAVPTYQYVCTNPDDKHEFERVQSFTDEPVSECPVCGSPVRKVYGSVGVVFKGSGFYRTDSRAAASSKNGSSSSGDSSSGDSSSSSDSSSKSSSSSGSSDSSSSSKSSSKSSSSTSGSAAKAA